MKGVREMGWSLEGKMGSRNIFFLRWWILELVCMLMIMVLYKGGNRWCRNGRENRRKDKAKPQKRWEGQIPRTNNRSCQTGPVTNPCDKRKASGSLHKYTDRLSGRKMWVVLPHRLYFQYLPLTGQLYVSCTRREASPLPDLSSART